VESDLAVSLLDLWEHEYKKTLCQILKKKLGNYFKQKKRAKAQIVLWLFLKW